MGQNVADESIKQFKRRANFGEYKIVRIALCLCPAYQFWNLRLWDTEVACFLSYRFAGVLIVVPLELDYVSHHGGEAPRHYEQIVREDV
jgi:hypothetical protein